MAASPPVARTPVVTRSESGADTSRGGRQPLGKARGIVLHHSAQGYSYAADPCVSEADGIRAVKAVQASHLQRGFADTGYHYLVTGAGRIYQGREYVAPGSFGPGRTPPALALGSHVRHYNTGRIGVCVLGCFGGAKGCADTPSPAALLALEKLLVTLARRATASPPAPSSATGT